MNLGEALRRYLKAESRGQLIIKLRGEEHLCKVSIEDGEAVYISLGKLGPAEALEALYDKQAEWINFIQGMPGRKKMPHSLNKQLMEIVFEPRPSSSPPLQNKTSPPKTDDRHEWAHGAPPKTVESIIEDFIDLIGPLGAVLAEQAAQDLGYRQGMPMEPAALVSFITVLAGEIPETERQAFIDKYSSRETGQQQ